MLALRTLSLALSLCAIALAQTTPARKPLTVGVATFPPYVMQPTPDRFQGFDIEMWDRLAGPAELTFEYKSYEFPKLLEALRNGEVDAGLAGITITSRRDRDIDFSYPYVHTGLRIMVRPTGTSLVELVRSAASSNLAAALVSLLGFILFCAHLLYFAERDSGAISRKYFPGIAEAAWCILATMTTVGYGDISPRRWFGRFIAFLVMVSGIGLFGLIIADLSAGLTLQQLQSDIGSIDDLRTRPVATVADSTSVPLLESAGASVVALPTIAEALGAFQRDEVDAVVFDEAPLLRYVADSGDKNVLIVGPLIEPQNYGIAFPQHSPIREPINRALLEFQESGEFAALHRKWFGTDPN